MEALLKDVLEQLKRTLAFLDKLKVDKKQKAERDNVLRDLRSSIERCEDTLSRNQGGGETYDDVGPNNGLNPLGDDYYDDLGTPSPALPLPPPLDEVDAIYDDAGDETGQACGDMSGMTTQIQQIAPIDCESLTNPTIADFLELKKEKSLLKSWQKKWCVIHSGILYMYDTAKDKKQKEAFRISDYTFKVRDDNKRKERCFELRNSDKVYEFCASDKDSRIKWSWAFGGQNSGSLSDSPSASTEGNYDDLGDMPTSSKKKKGFAFGKKKPPKAPVKPAQIANGDDDGDIYEEAGGNSTYDDTGKTYDDTGMTYDDTGMTYDDTGVTYDDTGKTYDDTGNSNYDDTGFQQTYDDTGITEPDDVYEDTSSPAPSLPQRQQLPLPPTAGNAHRRTSQKDTLPPMPGALISSGFPGTSPALPPRDETGSASGTFARNRPAMPPPGAPGKRELPLLPGQEPQMAPSPTFPPPPPVEDDQNSDDGESLDVFGESKDDYINMYQGMWDCFAKDDDELMFKRGEIIHILSKEYDDYGWWTAESRHQEIGLVPVSYLMKAFDV